MMFNNSWLEKGLEAGKWIEPTGIKPNKIIVICR